MTVLHTEARDLLATIDLHVRDAKVRSLLRLGVLRLYAEATGRGYEACDQRNTLPAPRPDDGELAAQLAKSLHRNETRKGTGT